MRNQAWYQQLWRKKLNSLPVKESADTAWNDMQSILDEHMPTTIGHQGSSIGHTFVKSIINLLKILLPVLAIIGAIYLFIKKPVAEHKKLKTKIDSLKVNASAQAESLPGDSLHKDYSVKNKNQFDSTASLNILDSGKSHHKQNIVHASLSSSQNKHKQIGVYRLTKSPDDVAFNQRGDNLPTETVNKSVNTNHGNRLSQAGTTAEELKDTLLATGTNRDATITPNDPDTSVQKTPVIGNMAVIKIDTAKRAKIKSPLDLKKTPVENTDLPASISGKGESKISPVKEKTTSSNKSKKTKLKSGNDLNTPAISYGIKLGASIASGSGSNIFIGAFGTIRINNRWLIEPEINMHSARKITGEYDHASYFRPDSIRPFTIFDSRKLRVMDIPLNVQFKISDTWSIKGGPIFSFPLKQTDVNTRIGILPDRRDTLNNSRTVNTALSQSISSPKFTLAFAGGISYQLNHLLIESRYIRNFNSYNIASGLGSYRFNYQAIQLSIGWQMNTSKQKRVKTYK